MILLMIVSHLQKNQLAWWNQAGFWYLFLLVIFFSHASLAQTHVFNGYVYDASSGELLPGATVFDQYTKTGTATNRYGFYSLSLPSDSAYLRVTFVGYEVATHRFSENNSLKHHFYLKPQDKVLEEVVVTTERHDTRSDLPGASVTKIPIRQLESVPALLGEVDIMRALALTPGVSNGVEGTTGLLVRGGTPDQNLILLDEATVYNASHLFGLVSIFNSDAISDVSLIKGGFPARYGGRLSSIVDVRMKEGNNQKYEGKFNLGLVSSSAMLEGPILKGKTSFAVSARSSYLNLLLLPTRISYNQGNSDSYFTYHLYDLNAKVNHRFKDKSRLFLSFYNGQDTWQVEEGTPGIETSKLRLQWGNATATLRYNRTLGKKLFGNFMVNRTTYRYGVRTMMENYLPDQATSSYFNVASSIRDWNTKLAFDYFLNPQHTIKLGGEYIIHAYDPQQLDTSEDLNALAQSSAPIPADEAALYIEDNFKIGTKLDANLGLRYSFFDVQGQQYQALEPRASLEWAVTGGWDLQASYSYMQQYIHLLSNNGAGFPNDIWVPATAAVLPQQASQWTLGIEKSFEELGLDISLEAYLKSMQDLIDYQNASNVVYNYDQDWQDIVVTGGEGLARGLELFVHKDQGKWNGWLSYTLSMNERRFEEINQGNWYPAAFDRRHDVSITGSYQFTKKWKMSSSWLFSTGQPVTLPVAFQEDLRGEQVPVYPGRNNARMPAYHRLDLALSRSSLTRRGCEATLTFGVYNLYNRRNPFFLTMSVDYQQIDPNDLNSPFVPSSRQVRQQSLLPFLPSISYSLKF